MSLTLDQTSVEVRLQFGIIEGFVDNDVPTVAQFLGIPYAEPPIGPLRWAPPKPSRPVSKLQALSCPHSCPQVTKRAPSLYNQDVPQLNSHGPFSEDCLKLSIFAPSSFSTGANLPVLVWIHGGGFQTGGSDTVFENPKMWVERSAKHIVVKVNYRLNIFGFPNASALQHGEQNLGLLDVRLALEWIRTNISYFGGDLSRIILWGQSAGAMLTDYYNYAYPEDSIISGIILNSGSALLPFLDYDPKLDHSHFSWVAQGLGFNGLSPEEELEFMRYQTADTIVDFITKNKEMKHERAVEFLPIIDEKTIFRDYGQRMAEGKFSKTPALIGTTTNEGVGLSPFQPDAITEDWWKLANSITFHYFWAPAQHTTINRHASSVSTYRFSYDGNFPNISSRSWQKAFHSAELPLIFGTSTLSDHGPVTSYQDVTSAALQDAYLAFLEDPENGLATTGWKAWEPSLGFTMLIGGSEPQPMQGIGKDEVKSYEDGIRPEGAAPTAVPKNVDLAQE